MPGCARKMVVDQDEVGVYHVWRRCVRRAWLCGDDPVSGKYVSTRNVRKLTWNQRPGLPSLALLQLRRALEVYVRRQSAVEELMPNRE